VINRDFAKAGIQYSLRAVSRTVNKTWYTGVSMGSPAERAMKKALRRGTYRDVNVYFAKLPSSILGWCTLSVSPPFPLSASR
jgi:hypothetical protein